MSGTRGAVQPAVSPRDSLGCALGMLTRSQQMAGHGFTIYRKTVEGAQRQRLESDPSDRGLLLGIALAEGHRRRIFRDDRGALYDFAEGGSYVRNFCDGYKADLESGFDFLLIEVSRGALNRTFVELGLPTTEGLAHTPGTDDPVLYHLASALLPGLAREEERNPLLTEQIITAILTHLARKYHGGIAKEGAARGLSRAQEHMAKELLSAGLHGNVLIADIADACNLSRGYFIRAFKETTGSTPYHWLVMQKVERARVLLLSTQLPLAEIAVTCGFSDQSHMTRTFTRLTGRAPGAWRQRQ